MFRTLLFTCAICVVCVVASNVHLHPLSDEFIESINFNQNTWIAGRNFPKKTPLKYIYNLMGTLSDSRMDNLPQRNYTFSRKTKYPNQFDAREHWKNCPTLKDIRDQGGCGSCWAVAAVSAMTDRMCILSKGKEHFYFSIKDVLSCCKYCGNGCEGGVLTRAWIYYKNVGIVSGGSYKSKQGCQPYTIPPCNHLVWGEIEQCKNIPMTPKCKNIPVIPEQCKYIPITPKCEKKCNKNYKVCYIKDRHRGKSVYVVKKSEIIKEIYEYGPVTSSFTVYEDFLNYKEGIYNYTSGQKLGLHSVKIIGWGEERGIKYWLAANSFNTDWGDNGFFKIIREGVGSCGISDNVVAGR
ncbi:unnamed protein product [Chilo suppressalis]|uniref:Peptidase C1A papain C-terminal domain-containing protein n=1 Tax=Chilo suppressalis TaxID=168631 RepID=A0ABN8L4A5_CHISP|nr:unnamed protein product [Chilo suppressalis]